MVSRQFKLSEIALRLSAELRGDPEVIVDGIASLQNAQPTQLSFLYDLHHQAALKNTQAAAVILPSSAFSQLNDLKLSNILLVSNAHLSYAQAAKLFEQLPQISPGIDPTATIGADCHIDKTAYVGARCVIGQGVTIGAHTIVHSGTVIGDSCQIGADCLLWANVTLYYGITLGDRVLIQSGAVIGSDGFGMANDKGRWFKIPQLGAVIIGNDVEVGANTTIDRGALDNTIIEEGVKLDNLIQIAHNVRIGAHTIIAAATIIAGSAVIGKYCMIGGGVSINGHLEIADKVILTAMASVPSSIKEAGIYSSGLPLQSHQVWRKNVARFKQLDDMARRLKKLEKENL